MSESKEAAPAGSEGSGAAIDPTAVALAMGGASRERADAFLKDQQTLIAAQLHHLNEQLQQIHLDIWEKWLGVFLRAATAIVGMAAAGAVCWLVWQASHSNGLRIEPFSVPPDLAARGLTGEVVATKLLDRLVAMQKQTDSARPAKSYAHAWGEHGIKLEIPETGVSLSELDAWLREKLGHDTRISGEVVRTEKGLTLTARTEEASAPGVSGPEQDLDALTDRLAEEIYGTTQPYRFGMYLVGKDRVGEALVVFRHLALTGDREDRMWAYGRWGGSVATLYGADAGLPIVQRSIEIEPGTIGSYDSIVRIRTAKGQWEQALRTLQAQHMQLLGNRQTYVGPSDVAARIRYSDGQIALALGGFRDGLPVFEEFSRNPFPGFALGAGPGQRAEAHIGEHDIAAAQVALEEAHNVAGSTPQFDLIFASRESRNRQDWPKALAADTQLLALAKLTPLERSTVATAVMPYLAQSMAHLGRFAEAEHAIAPTPADCYPCLRIRAQIAELQHQRARADFWFARATTADPSFPFAFHEWGRAFLTRGEPDAAIAQFAIAIKKSPHFADPLEGWGEALMAKNQSHLALAKFAEAEKYAPNWGRLHLKWGEALEYAGKRDEAKAQFARAAPLDLTPSEKAELAEKEHV